jgi:hypothetical protein
VFKLFTAAMINYCFVTISFLILISQHAYGQASDPVNLLIKGFEPLIERGKEWQCRATIMHRCNEQACISAKEEVDWFEVELSTPKFRLCSTKKWIDPNQGECLDWNDAVLARPGIYTLVAGIGREGYVKIENTTLNFIAVGNFFGLSNKTYLGKCNKKS